MTFLTSLLKTSQYVTITVTVTVIVTVTAFRSLDLKAVGAIEIEKERMASPKLTREFVYEKRRQNTRAWADLLIKLRQFYEFYLIASFLF